MIPAPKGSLSATLVIWISVVLVPLALFVTWTGLRADLPNSTRWILALVPWVMWISAIAAACIAATRQAPHAPGPSSTDPAPNPTKDTQDAREALLKEMHHRVKNNLQLVASILNLEIRSQTDPNAIATLRRIQSRFMTLGTVHQHLYGTPDLDALPVDMLLRQIALRQAPQDCDLALDLAAAELYPDQCMPLALFVNEALAQTQWSSPAKARLSLSALDPQTLRVSFSADHPVNAESPVSAQLLAALAQQLGSELGREDTSSGHRLTLTFGISEAETRP